MTGHWNTAVREVYGRLDITLARSSGSDAAARCFASPDAHHREDRHPSVSVSLVSGAWFCHACGARGGAYDAAILRGHTPRSAIDLLIAHGLAEPRQGNCRRRSRASGTSPVASRATEATPVREHLAVTHKQVLGWAAELARHQRLLDRLLREREISGETVARFEIGFDGRRITIPTRDASGSLTGLLRWLPFDRGTVPKMLAVPGTQRDLFPAPETLAPGAMVLCEGEPDALAGHSAGIPAVSIPGAASWRQEWVDRFIAGEVQVVFDCDAAGRAAARTVADGLRGAGIPAAVIDLAPMRDDGYDLTDHIRARRVIARRDSSPG